MDVPLKTPMKTLIRSDSSGTIGIGHVMRDLVLAKRLGGEISFASIAQEGDIISQIPYQVFLLNSNNPDELIDLIQTEKFERVIFDHYDIDEKFEHIIKDETNVTIISIDDTYQPHHCDILLNHNFYADPSKYASLVPHDCVLWCGGEHFLIREEFIHEKTHQREKIYDLLIAMGGADSANLSLKLAQENRHLSSIAILTTTANLHLKSLQAYAAEHPHIHLLINSNETAKIMNQSRRAILTPSTIAQEAIYMDLPFEVVQTAPNQADMVGYLRQNGYTIREYIS